jgi:hypothetical protein
MEEYTFSALIKNDGLFEKPKPHSVWWRRILGQTESERCGTERVSITFKAPREIVEEKWFQDVLKTTCYGATCYQLGINNPPTPYIPKTGGLLIEASRKNFFMDSEGVHKNNEPQN